MMRVQGKALEAHVRPHQFKQEKLTNLVLIEMLVCSDALNNQLSVSPTIE